MCPLTLELKLYTLGGQWPHTHLLLSFFQEAENIPRLEKGLWSKCDGKQVQLFSTTKANTQESGADVKESGLFEDAASRRGGLISKSPSPHLSGGKAFYKEGEGNRTKR